MAVSTSPSPDPILTFHGAARAVTGSCFRLETGQGQVLIDCGLFQGSKTEKELNYRPFPFDPRQIDAVVLSHAHIDHSGLLPKLTRHGFEGTIHATPATMDLCDVMLADSAHIQEIEVEQYNRRAARRRRGKVTPIYTIADATACLKQFTPQRIGDWFDVIPGLRARFWNAGHLLGSASIEVELICHGASPTRLLFSADIGPDHKLLQSDPEGPSGIDYLVCESTYGDTDRIDASAKHRRAMLAEEVRAAMNPDGALLIPSFAVERAQEFISDLAQLMAEGTLPAIPIYVDSPLATRATEVFARHARELEGGANLTRGIRSDHLHFTETREQSIALDQVRGFHIVIAASGMCEAGRIRHRLRNWIWREEATVLLTGYQAEGTLGRILQNGAQTVRIQGEEFSVRARIRSINLYSGHADGPELVQWVRERLPLRHDLFLVHGEPDAMDALAGRLAGTVAPDHIRRPVLDEGFSLTETGARSLSISTPPRLPPEKIARLDWHNDLSELILDINEAMSGAADERSRDALVRRLRRAIEDEGR
ncbi:Ribonuclease [Hartmannibacter diazotrophicus]|uniref:Ribonuclease n=1 Tax=Hartmannibacter diazotrophicus TaxID=1482074 RepID=A0A2C9DCH3_9HYPH|nr:MBL fold metallo-hydrolase [Hartmannibacter diazotrophicus]SON57828.1 Ribonuclease [Hartmannibacter diazotrophicus]